MKYEKQLEKSQGSSQQRQQMFIEYWLWVRYIFYLQIKIWKEKKKKKKTCSVPSGSLETQSVDVEMES